MSYDLDGDGVVGSRDLFLGLRFDKDKDGRLNTQEKKEAINAIKNGYEKKFHWGLDNAGKQGHPVHQVKGVVCYEDDYSKLTENFMKNFST